jgi:hypothetical protein
MISPVLIYVLLSSTVSIEPVKKSVTSGKTVIFTVLTNLGSAFQWQHNNANIIGEEMNHLKIMNVMKMNEGNYSCNVTFSLGKSILSKAAQLFVCKW